MIINVTIHGFKMRRHIAF